MYAGFRRRSSRRFTGSILGLAYDTERFGSGRRRKQTERLILCYPVIIEDDGKTHDGTKQRFTEGKPEKLEYFGLDKRVTSNTPKSFIWHTFEDSSVPVYIQLRFASALLEHGVEYELHIYPRENTDCRSAIS